MNIALYVAWNRPLKPLEVVMLKQNPWRLFWRGRVGARVHKLKSMRKRRAFIWIKVQEKGSK